MKYLKITNQGEMDPQLITLMGASTKREATDKIGRFGSGLKYSLAYLLAHNIGFRLFIGKKEIKFSTEKKLAGGQYFEVIVVNGRRTDLTTGMGPDWNEWCCIREIYCNALDEGLTTRAILDSPNEKQFRGQEGTTAFYLAITPEMEKITSRWNDYFASERTYLAKSDYGTLYSGGDKTVVYKQGVKVFERDFPSVFHYELPDLEINELRVCKDEHEMKCLMVNAVLRSNSEGILPVFIEKLGHGGYFESTELSYHFAFIDSARWTQALKGRKVVAESMLDTELVITLMRKHDTVTLPYELTLRLMNALPECSLLNKAYLETQMRDVGPEDDRYAPFCDRVEDAISALQSAGYRVAFPWQAVEFPSRYYLGRADEKTGMFYLSISLAQGSTEQLMAVIVEENEHLLTGYGDCSREFQTALIGKWVRTLLRLADETVS